MLSLLQVSFGLQVSLEEGEQAEMFPAVMAAVRHRSAVDAAVSHEAGGQVEGLGAERTPVWLLSGVCVHVVSQQLLQTVTLTTDFAVEWLLPGVAPLVDFKLRRVGELLAADLTGDDGVSGRQLVSWKLVRVFADDVVLQAAVALAADEAELPVSSVDHLVAVQVGSLGEALSAGGALVWTDFLVHKFVARQVAGVIEALPTDVADEGLLEVSRPVCFQHTDGGVSFAADVTVAGLLSSVPSFNVQVSMSLMVEPLRAVVAGVRQQPVIFALVFTELQDTGEQRPTHRAHRVRLVLVVRETLRVWKQHATL